ncbi:MAG TPA: hypothetical protein VFT98_02935 [Myxococcota bacterium]|nr:hypothetical protein [Myxococcota bacterium]
MLTPAAAHSITGASRAVALLRGLGVALAAALAGTAAFAEQEPEPPATEPAAAEEAAAAASAKPAYSFLPLDYTPARGVTFGSSGLTIGGFSTFELERPDREETELALDSVNFLVLYEPVDSLRFFGELEVGDLFSWESGSEEVESDPNAFFERLYAEYGASDALNFRFGKFQTPVGRWNLTPAEPFTWLATGPAIVEEGFDEHQTGVAIHGSFYPEKRVVSYWVYGQVIDAFDAESDDDPADRSVGGRLEYGDARGAWSFGASLLGSKKDGEWAATGGVDAKLRIGERLELSSEALVSGGDVPGRDYWGAFVEAAYPLDQLSPKLAKLYLVGRVEHFDLSGAEAVQLVDFGLTWLPKDWLNLKVGYRAAIENAGDLNDGLKLSFSVLF